MRERSVNRDGKGGIVTMGSGRILEFAPEGSAVLREKCRKLSAEEVRSVEVQRLIRDMYHTVRERKMGVGLSANQVGRKEAISVIAIKPTPARPDLVPFDKVCINTEIVETFGEKELMWEGCLSTAVDENGEASMAQVPRYRKVRIEYLDGRGSKQSEVVEGFVAHVVQHETDHLNGVLFTDLIDRDRLISYRDYIKLMQIQDCAR